MYKGKNVGMESSVRVCFTVHQREYTLPLGGATTQKGTC